MPEELAKERRDLQQTAIATGERFGALEARVEYHDGHLKEINGAIRDGANATGRLATEMAVQSVAIIKIQETLAKEEQRHTQKTTWSIQVWLAIFAFGGAVFIAFIGICITVALALLN